MVDPILDNWQVQVRKGLLELCVLNSLRNGRRYGYDIVKQLRQLEGLMIGEGTIYPLLSRFRKQGLIEAKIEESPDGPARKYYRLTPRGADVLNQMNHLWNTMETSIRTLWGTNP